MGKTAIKHLNQLKEFKKKISSDLPLDKVILFGSRAKGAYNQYSDFDFIVVSKKFRNVHKLDRAVNLYLKWNLNYPVDFLCYTPEEFNKLKKQITIVREAVEEGIEI